MSKVHFDPHNDGYPPDNKTACGVFPCEEEYKCSSSFPEVTCGRCIKSKNRLTETFEREEKDICDQLGDMADFFNKEGRYSE